LERVRRLAGLPGWRIDQRSGVYERDGVASAYDWQRLYQQLPAAERQRIKQQLDQLSQQDREALLD
jgi:hypothetical protein